MSAIKLVVHGTGSGQCCLTGKEGDGLTVSFEDGTVQQSFLSWRAFRQLLALKTTQSGRQEPPRPAVVPASAPLPAGKPV